jgi:hypothetical protein
LLASKLSKSAWSRTVQQTELGTLAFCEDAKKFKVQASDKTSGGGIASYKDEPGQ